MTATGPTLLESAKAGGFDLAMWKARTAHAETLDIEGVIRELERQKATYAKLVDEFPEADLRTSIEMFGSTSSKGAFIVN